MDVAKYIGTFLLKNQFCYIHGLGNLELRRKPASFDGEALQGPQYTVALTSGGSIDDNLAAFIANGEQTSISKAANALRDFATAARADLQAGKNVPLPGVGTFTMQGGSIGFVTDEALAYRPPSVPVLKSAKRLEEEPSFKTVSNVAPSSSSEGYGGSSYAKPRVAWGKIVLLALLALGVIAGIIAGLRYLNAPDKESVIAPPRTEVALPPTRLQNTPATQMPDTAAAPVASAPQPSASDEYKVVLNTYATRAQAERRLHFLGTTALGTAAQIVSADSSTHRVTIAYTAPLADSTRVLDSLSRTYGGRAALMR